MINSQNPMDPSNPGLILFCSGIYGGNSALVVSESASSAEIIRELAANIGTTPENIKIRFTTERYRWEVTTQNCNEVDKKIMQLFHKPVAPLLCQEAEPLSYSFIRQA